MSKNNNTTMLAKALDSVKQFADNSDDNIAFGFMANTKNFKVGTFVKGLQDSVIAMLCAEMERSENVAYVVTTACRVFEQKDEITPNEQDNE